MRGILLWLLGIPIPILILLYLFHVSEPWSGRPGMRRKGRLGGALPGIRP